ncbi:MAG: orotidine-5'-phosphate decarboxylase [Gammaproteobacteria bacterium]|nr:orotidine-5'-phosphate decarboxylase [Gammaproteobacteria bacterium]
MKKPIIIALDFDTEQAALSLLEQVDPGLCRVKIGKELFTACGPQFVHRVVKEGFDVFLDLKFHDIPNTVSAAVMRAADLGVWMINLHASGGLGMMEQARQSLERVGEERPLLIAVTVLTSLVKQDLVAIGLNCEPQDQVLRLADLARKARLDGVVCSATETAFLRRETGQDFLLVTPGIRRPEDASGDQRRVTGPAEAMANGSDFLVVGRPITRASSPRQALQDFITATSG